MVMHGHTFSFTTETERTCYQTSEEQQFDFHPFTSAVISMTDTQLVRSHVHNAKGIQATTNCRYNFKTLGVFVPAVNMPCSSFNNDSLLLRTGPPGPPGPSRLVIPLARLCPKRCCHLLATRLVVKAAPNSSEFTEVMDSSTPKPHPTNAGANNATLAVYFCLFMSMSFYFYPFLCLFHH